MTKPVCPYIITLAETQRKRCGVGVYRDEGPPVPIPNTAVKLISADNTWLEAAREDKATPTQIPVKGHTLTGLYFASLAQSVEHAAVNRRVVGSSPTGGAMLG